MLKLYYYFKKLWHQHIVCDAFLITFVNETNISDTLVTVYGDKIQILWEKEVYREGYRTYYKYWVRPVTQSA